MGEKFHETPLCHLWTLHLHAVVYLDYSKLHKTFRNMETRRKSSSSTCDSNNDNNFPLNSFSFSLSKNRKLIFKFKSLYLLSEYFVICLHVWVITETMFCTLFATLFYSNHVAFHNRRRKPRNIIVTKRNKKSRVKARKFRFCFEWFARQFVRIISLNNLPCFR